MSWTKTLTLWCDGPSIGGRCFNWTVGEGTHNQIHDIRRTARAQGWRYRGRQDLCPTCAKTAP